MESTLDFEQISKKLEALAESQPDQRNGKSIELLNKVRPALLKAREKKVPFKTLAEFLKENGIVVGSTTLRRYLNALSSGKKARKRQKKKSTVNLSNVPTEESQAVQQLAEKKLPPRLARHTNIS